MPFEDIQTLMWTDIRINGGTQCRVELNQDVIAEYAECIDELPPVLVYFDGATYWLVDGFHRYFAHKRAKRMEMKCRIHNGDQRDAIYASLSANAAYGIKRTREDKRRAVMTMLVDKEWFEWSDREIAKACGVSHPFVGDLRAAYLAKKAAPVQSGNVTTPEAVQPVESTSTRDDDVIEAKRVVDEVFTERPVEEGEATDPKGKNDRVNDVNHETSTSDRASDESLAQVRGALADLFASTRMSFMKCDYYKIQKLSADLMEMFLKTFPPEMHDGNESTFLDPEKPWGAYEARINHAIKSLKDASATLRETFKYDHKEKQITAPWGVYHSYVASVSSIATIIKGLKDGMPVEVNPLMTHGYVNAAHQVIARAVA